MIKSTETIDTIIGSRFEFIRRSKEIRIFGIKAFKKITFPIVLRKDGKKWENLYL